jgi:hypothetical protein
MRTSRCLSPWCLPSNELQSPAAPVAQDTTLPREPRSQHCTVSPGHNTAAEISQRQSRVRRSLEADSSAVSCAGILLAGGIYCWWRGAATRRVVAAGRGAATRRGAATGRPWSTAGNRQANSALLPYPEPSAQSSSVRVPRN